MEDSQPSENPHCAGITSSASEADVDARSPPPATLSAKAPGGLHAGAARHGEGRSRAASQQPGVSLHETSMKVAMKQLVQPPLVAPTRFQLQPGGVYRRKDLAAQSRAVDRDLQLALGAGLLHRAAQGLYYAPIKTPFGDAPPDDRALVGKFLEDRHFLLLNPSYYNSLRLGTTQLYNQTRVYNHKRHGQFTLGNRTYDFRVKHRFPDALSIEFLWVDCLNNLNELAEDPDAIVRNARKSLDRFDSPALHLALTEYGSAATLRLVRDWFDV